jgi:iron complex transport system substrate-binding protein
MLTGVIKKSKVVYVRKKRQFPMTKCFIMLWLFLSILSPFGCARQKGEAINSYPEGDGYPLSIVDDLGNTVVIRQKPERILSGALFADELLLSIARKEHLIGVTSLAQDREASNVADKIGEIEYKIPFNVEYYISAEPDVVILAAWSSMEGAAQLRDAGITVCMLEFPVTFAQVIEKIRLLARITDEKERGEELVRWMQAKLERIEETLSPLKEEEKLEVMDYSMDFGTSFGKGSMWDEMVRHAGLRNAVAHFHADIWGTVPVSKEILIKLDPDIIVLPGWIFGKEDGAALQYRQFMDDPAFRVLSAVRNRRVFQIPEKHRSSGSHYSVLGVEDLARRAYPSLFE